MSNYNVELWVRDTKDSDLRKADIEIFQFPGGELQVKSLDDVLLDTYEAVVYVRGADPYTTVALDVLQQSLYSKNIEKFALAVPYLPAARSDRGELATLPLYLRRLQDFMIGLPFKNSLRVLDVHNPEAVKDWDTQSTEIKYGFNVDPMVLSGFFVDRGDGGSAPYTGVIAPDKGAVARAHDVADFLGLPLFTAQKERDFETGKLTKFGAPEGLESEGSYLIVDDICDGGGTFAGLISGIDDCYDDNNMSFDLWVTHGVFSGKWEENLMDNFENVYTTNSHPNTDNINHPRVHVFDIRPYMIGEIN